MINKKVFGLALSGGGVRAAAFHLGVLDKLFELNLIDKIDVISTVSGGSIIGAFYCLNKNNFEEFKNNLIHKLNKSIEIRIIFNWRILLAIVLPRYSRTDILANIYNKLYYENKCLSDVEHNPKLIINATNLASGKNWKFSQGYMGDWKIGYEGNIEKLKVSTAVAASSAVPGIFYPIQIKTDNYFGKTNYRLKRIPLCDGGVYDNQGLHSLLSDFDENIKCDYIICSDASAPFNDSPNKISSKIINVLLRQNDIMMARIKNMQFQDAIYGQHKNKIKAAYFSINWDVNNLIKSYCDQEDLCKKLGFNDLRIKYNNEKDLKKIERIEMMIKNKLNYPEFDKVLNNTEIKHVSSIGTRLYKLSTNDISLLMRHGSTLCGIQVKTYLLN